MRFQKKHAWQLVTLWIVSMGFLTQLHAEAVKANFSGKSCFEILGIPKTAGKGDLQRVYRKLALQHHPDRFSSKSEAIRKEEEENFKLIKACYEAISELDPKKLGGMGVELGLTESEILSRKRGESFSSYESHPSSSSPRWNSEGPSRASEAGSDSNHWFNPNRWSRANPGSSARGLKNLSGLFKNNILGVYQNDHGVIIYINSDSSYDNSTKSREASLFWIPRGSRLVYPVYGGVHGTYGEATRGGYIYDTRDREGRVPIVIDYSARTLKVRSLTFYEMPIPDLVRLNDRMKEAGFELQGHRLSQEELNIWHYTAFFDGVSYTILAQDKDERGYLNRTRLFVGNRTQMDELKVVYDSSTGLYTVPDHEVNLRFSGSYDSTPFFDHATGFHLGTMDLNPSSLSVFKMGTPMEKIREIPQVAWRDVYKFPIVELLGEHLLLPKIVRTPLDPLFGADRAGSVSSELPLLGHQEQSSRTPLPTSAKSHQKSLTADVEISAWQRLRWIKDAFPSLKNYFEHPDGDEYRKSVEWIFSGEIQLEDLRDYVVRHIHEKAVFDVLVGFYGDLKSWELMEALMFIPETMVDTSIERSDRQKILIATMFPIRQLIRKAPGPLSDRIERMILKLRRNGELDVSSYLDDYLRDRQRNGPLAAIPNCPQLLLRQR